MIKHSGILTLTTPSDREVAMSRVFDAPRELVFEAYTKPELVRRWLGVIEGWSFRTCEIDLRVGGAYRYLWDGPDGATLGIRGHFLEITRNERIVCTERFDPPFDQGEAIDTVTFLEHAGKTALLACPPFTLIVSVTESGELIVDLRAVAGGSGSAQEYWVPSITATNVKTVNCQRTRIVVILVMKRLTA